MVLDVRAAQYRYGTNPALDGVNLRVEAGECLALLGPNGAGKTTLVNLAVGLLRPDAGTVAVTGRDPRHATTRRNLGVVQQSLGFPRTLTVGELTTGAAVRAGTHRSAAAPVLVELGLQDLVHRRAAKLSGGQKQRLQLAMALVAEPALLVLDEPTVGLDAAARKDFWTIIHRRRARGTAVLITTHLIEESATVAERVVVLDRGRVLARGSPEELVTRLPDRTVIARTELETPRLSALPGVVAVDDPGNGQRRLVRLGTHSPEDLLRALLTEDPDLSDLRVEGASLEEAVLTLTGRAS